MEQVTFRAMGCQMVALLERQAASAPEQLAEVPRWFAAWEQHVSRFRDDSELSQLNRTQGQWQAVSPVMWDVVEAAFQAASHSDGLVSPALLNALEASGYDRSFELIRDGVADSGTDEHTAQALCILSWWTITRDAQHH